MQAVAETVFDTAYLTSVVSIGAVMIAKSMSSKRKKQYLLFGIMAVTLGCGDSFHLIPRMISQCAPGLGSLTAALGFGKLVTSITMTAFYVLLYYVWRQRYHIEGKKELTTAVWMLSIARVVLCLMPQNRWTSTAPSYSWGIYRNIPFAILGAILVVLYHNSAKEHHDHDFRYMWLAITISFACYIPVVLGADKIPALGALMIPKTCAYLWAVMMGFKAMKKSDDQPQEVLAAV